MQAILITGGCGFIGTNVALEAVSRGHKVIVMDSLVRPGAEKNFEILKETKNVEILRGDVRNPSDFQRSPIPDAIIHLAANPGIPWSIVWPAYDFDVNARGALNALEYARIMGPQVGRKIPVIFASTNKVYSDIVNEIPVVEKGSRYEWNKNSIYGSYKEVWGIGVGGEGISEEFPIDGFGRNYHSPYGVSKIAGDLYCQEYWKAYGLPTVVNRMSCVYGLYQKGVADQGWADHFIRRIAFGNGKIDVFGDGKQVRDMLWGGDVARLYVDEVEQIDKVAGSVFNVGGGPEKSVSILEAIWMIEGLSKKHAEIEFHGWRHADQKVYISDTSKVRAALGWEPVVSPEDGFRTMIEWYKESGI